jgi:hypothetical protein
MLSPSRLVGLLTATFCTSLGMAAAPAGAVTVGIAEQKPAMFSDPRFAQTGIGHARYNVGWDAMDSAWQIAELDAWLSGAQAAGVQPLVTFSQSRLAGRTRLVPTQAQLGRAFRLFRARYPQVRQFAAWNEANFCGQPTCHKPEVVAGYYREMRRQCASCTVLAAELLDMPNMQAWARAFVRANGGRQPAVWGLHNYVSVNRMQTAGTRQLLKTVKGKVWLTETGGIVRRTPKKSRKGSPAFPESSAHAAAVTSFIFRRIVPLSPRIQRVYLYMWDAGPASTSWDSGLIGPDGTIRPALSVLTQYLPGQPKLV